MTILEVPPTDHAPRTASSNVDDFPVPQGREEEWRFTPVDQLEWFMHVDPQAEPLIAKADDHVAVIDASDLDVGSWLPTDRPAAVARAGAKRAVEVRIGDDENVSDPIVVDLTGSSERAYALVGITAGRYSSATVVVLHDAGRDVNGVLLTQVREGASLTVVSVLDGPATNAHLWQWHADVARDASFVGATATLGGRIVRILPSITFSGPGASAELLGAFLADGDQYMEHRSYVEHALPHCTSNVVYKGALSGAGAHTVWVGDVLVRPTAIGTTTYEMNRNLLLDDGPRADSVPNLELETGDVASAGHASATGRFDDEQLFYLQSRGIPEGLARQLVVRGFFVDVLNRIPSVEWREAMLERIANRLGMPTTDEGSDA